MERGSTPARQPLSDPPGDEKMQQPNGIDVDGFSNAELAVAMAKSHEDSSDSRPPAELNEAPSQPAVIGTTNGNNSQVAYADSAHSVHYSQDCPSASAGEEGANGDSDVVMPDLNVLQDTEATPTKSARKRRAPQRLGDELEAKARVQPEAKSRKTDPDTAASVVEDQAEACGSEGSKDTTADSSQAPDIMSGETTRAKEEATRGRPRRNRQGPKHYEEEDTDAEFTVSSPIKGPDATKGSGKSRRGGARGNWTPESLLQDSKSKLVKANVVAILKDTRAWTGLSPAQQAELISLLPNSPCLNPPADPAEPLPNIPQQMLSSNSAFKADIALFQEDLHDGRLDPGWQHDALVAMERRATGEFDNWKEAEMEAFWGQKQKLSHHVIAGESSKIKFEALVAAGCWVLGDVWTFSRRFGKGKGALKVEKEATISSITPDNRLTFTFPPGTAKFSSPAAGADIETEPINGPQNLADAITRTDGRISEWRANNAWKEFRCSRKNLDIGSPWEIREIYWAREEESSQMER